MTLDLKPGDPWPFTSSRGLFGLRIDPAWYALICAPQQEKRTAHKLIHAGAEVQYPTVTTVRHVKGQKREVERPMISGIIYARISYQPHWDVMRERQVITGVFSRGGEPIRLSDDDIARVMGLPTEAERIEAERIEAERPVVGGRAELTGGPLGGVMVDVERVEYGRVWWSTITGLRGTTDVQMVRRA